MSRDWIAWHERYDGDSQHAKRLPFVRRRIAEAINDAPAGPIRLISMCAGDGRDVLGALDGHPRRGDVRGRLVELNPTIAERAEVAVKAAGIVLEVVRADAGSTDAYAGAVPAEVVLVCGVFGNLSLADVERTIRLLPTLCAARATVIWTRTREAPDITPAIRGWFVDAGFEELAFDQVPDSLASVGVNRLVIGPAAFVPGERIFQFVE